MSKVAGTKPGFAALFTPKLVTVWREGYDRQAFIADALAGLTVAIVALPLSMAIAIATGLAPARGLYAAIIGGFLVSALGGSRFQIGGPAGAFIVLVATIVERHGIDGLLLATLLSGLIMMTIGWLRLGTYVKYIPFPVTVGFTSGIATIIMASQFHELLGLEIAHEPAALVPKLQALSGALGSYHPAAIGVAALALATIIVLRRWKPRWPGLLIAVALCGVISAGLHLDITTVGSRFGEMPNGLQMPGLPTLSFEKFRDAIPDALAIALLGAIESLLSAVVADGMTGRRHRSNCELVAQGVANAATALFGGMPVTGTIARTATNVKAGARGPVAGMLHSVYLLAFLLLAAPLAAYVPLAALAAVLVNVAWSMADREEFIALLGTSRGDALVLVTTFLLTILVDLATAIGVGVTMGAFVFLHRMAEAVEIEGGGILVSDDVADDVGRDRRPYLGADALDRDVVVFRINGAFFFGATGTVVSTLDRIGQHPRIVVLDFANVPLIDSTAARTLQRYAHQLRRGGTRFVIAAARASVRRALQDAGLSAPDVQFAATVDEARALAATMPSSDPRRS
jgi:SulP family sulfate permease